MSGTSMASPHAAGVAALYLQNNTNASPSTVRDAIVNIATSNKVNNPGSGSPNKLLYSIFGTASPTSTPTPTSTPPPNTTPTATPPAGANVVKNPKFEKGPGVGWQQYSKGGYQLIDQTLPHAGAYSAYLCDYDACADWVEQTITVPNNATLKYWWYQTSRENTTEPFDYLRVQLFATNGNLLKTVRTWSNKSARNKWSQDSISLAAYAGQRIKLRFSSTTDATLKSAFFIDDVVVK